MVSVRSGASWSHQPLPVRRIYVISLLRLLESVSAELSFDGVFIVSPVPLVNSKTLKSILFIADTTKYHKKHIVVAQKILRI
jgi:hypothetical protein